MDRTKALFGPAGNCEDFYAAGYKHTVQMFPWIHQHGLTAYEYQCGRGVRLSAESAAAIRALLKVEDISALMVKVTTPAPSATHAAKAS